MSSRYKGLSDNELVILIKDHDFQAFSELGERYLWLIQVKANSFMQRSAPEREDLYQEGYLGLFGAANTYEDGYQASFRTYAGVCISNQMISAARRHGNKQNELLNTSLSLDADDLSIGTVDSPEALFEGKEDYQRMMEKIHQLLSPLEQKVLTLYLSGTKRNNIETYSGMSLKAFDNAMYRVRRKLENYHL